MIIITVILKVMSTITKKIIKSVTLCKKCPYSGLFWFAFSHIQTEYGEILRISPYSVRMCKNVDQNNSKYGNFSRGVGRRNVF